MRFALFVLCSLFAGSLAAQVCDVTYTGEVETADGRDVSSSVLILRAVPMADVLDNSARALKVLDELSKHQGKGPYNIETGEVRACDGKPPERVPATSVLLQGVTFAGANKAARIGYKEADGVLKRYEDREKNGKKTGWDHDKGKKVKRNDLGQKLKD